MVYQIEKGIWSNVFAVPCQLVDEHIRLCSGIALKVLMVLLRHNRPMAIEEIVGAVGYCEEDVRDALKYWSQQGLLGQNAGTAASVAASAAPAQPVVPSPPPPADLGLGSPPVLQYQQADPATGDHQSARMVTLTGSRQRLTTAEINELAMADENIANLLQEMQQVMGKPLTPIATDTLVALYSYYGMAPDLILMLVQYCMTIGKNNIRYMEKVAVSWLEAGIDTHEKAEHEIVRAMERKSWEGKIKSAFGIYDRGLISSEKKFIQTWLWDYQMDLPLITLAYERTVEIKGKLSFSYINGILRNWHDKGITTPAQAINEIKDGRPKQQSRPGGQPTGSSYNIDELEELITYSSI